MSTVADVRKLLQDLIAPDLGALKEGQAALKEGLQALHAELKLVREEIATSESRTVRAVEKTREEIAESESRTVREVAKSREELAATEVRLMREIKNTQETLLLHLQNSRQQERIANQQERIAELTRELEQTKSQHGRLSTGVPALGGPGAATAIERS